MKLLFPLMAAATLSACATPGSLPRMIVGAPESLLAAGPLLEGSFCVLVSVVESCGGDETTLIEMESADIAPPPAIAIDPATGAAFAPIRVMTWNVEGLPPPLRFGRRDALGEIGEALREMRAHGAAPHVLLIQEGFMPDAMRQLIAESGYRYVARGPETHAPAPDEGDEMGDPWLLRGEGVGKLLGAGLYVLSDFPIVEARAEPFAHCAGVDCLSNKGAMLARIQVPGAPAPLAVVNTHMNSQNSTHTPRSRAHLAHRNQVDALERFVAANARAGEAIIFGGDFNMGGSPQRWEHAVPAEPFAFARTWCGARDEGCDLSALPARYDDPRSTQDQQGFHDGADIRLRPRRIAVLHDPAAGAGLSDHGAYLVEYRLEWGGAATAMDYAEAQPIARLFVSSSALARAAAQP